MEMDMDQKLVKKIQQAYDSAPRGDSIGLIQAILDVGAQTGMDDALACLQDCVIARRMAWLDAHLHELPLTGNALWDGYRIFFEIYLGLSRPSDGALVSESANRLVLRWWNPCSTLDACQHFGLDTCDICRKAYHQPVEAIMQRIDSRLHFDRNYNALRPHTPYCEEIIYLE
jgi:hypothetical protein